MASLATSSVMLFRINFLSITLASCDANDESEQFRRIGYILRQTQDELMQQIW